MKIDKFDGQKPKMSLRARLIMLLTWMVLPFIVFSAYKAYDVNGKLEKDAQVESLNLARSISQSIDDYIGATGDLLMSISNHNDVRTQNYPAINEWFKKMGPDYPYYANIIFVDTKGDIKAFVKQTKGAQRGTVNVSDTVYFERAAAASSLSIGDFMYGKLKGLPVVHVTHPVFSLEGERVGFVAASFDLTKIQHKLMVSNVPKHSVISVFDDKGIVIARSSNPEKWVGADVHDKPVFKLMNDRSEGEIKTTGMDGTGRLFGFASTTRVPWRVSVGVDNEHVYAQLKKELAYHFMVFIPLLLIALFGWVWIGRDVNKLHARTEYLTLVDPLTGLYNYRKLSRDLDFELQRSSRTKGELAFAMVDIDHFKSYNDNNGHQEGDEALRRIAGIMNATVRDTDTVYRCGGEELCVLLRDTDVKGAVSVMERVRYEVETANFTGQEMQPLGNLTISIGVAAYPTDSICKDGLIRCSDVALYKSKSDGRNRTEIYLNADSAPPVQETSYFSQCI